MLPRAGSRSLLSSVMTSVQVRVGIPVERRLAYRPLGTSSKSTKLVHGGVRYLQKAVFELDYDQYKLVREALHERRIFLQTAPYLSQMLPIMLPIYKYWQVPYYWSGCKMYDILAGKENMESSYLMSKGKALETFPMLKSDGLVGAVVYYDGMPCSLVYMMMSLRTVFRATQ